MRGKDEWNVAATCRWNVICACPPKDMLFFFSDEAGGTLILRRPHFNKRLVRYRCLTEEATPKDCKSDDNHVRCWNMDSLSSPKLPMTVFTSDEICEHTILILFSFLKHDMIVQDSGMWLGVHWALMFDQPGTMQPPRRARCGAGSNTVPRRSMVTRGLKHFG